MSTVNVCKYLSRFTIRVKIFRFLIGTVLYQIHVLSGPGVLSCCIYTYSELNGLDARLVKANVL